MDTPSNSPDKWKVSQKRGVLLFFFAVAAVVSLCVAVVLMRRRLKLEQLGDRQAEEDCSPANENELPPVCSWKAIKNLLSSSLHRTEASKLTQTADGSLSQTSAQATERSIWDGRGSMTVSPLWQRRILMGEKCELPRFSGLILYDERGLPLDTSSSSDGLHQEKAAAAVITLKDIL